MKFAEPSWLLAGFIVVAAMVFLYYVLDRRQRAALAEFASSHLLEKLTASFSPARRMVKRGLFLAAIACIFTALARPQWGYHWVDQKERGIDLFFAIDTSKSMLTQDVNPDRLERAKMPITDFVRKLDGDRVGLIAFAGEAFLQAPLTLDYDAFQDTLDSIDVNTIPRGGTNIASAIQEAQVAFANNAQNKKILILVTDGEDLDGQAIDAAKAAAKDGLVIYTVGVGTAAGGLIPVPNADGGTDFMKDPSTGEYVKSHLDENTLTQIAEATGGMYQPLGQEGQGLGVIYDKALASLPKHDIASRRTRVYEERFQWPLAAGIVLLFASLFIGTRRRFMGAGRRATVAARAAKAAALVTLAGLMVPALAHASVQSAESAYKKGDYSKAEKQYEDAAGSHPDDPALQYNLGAAAYKSGEYDTALPAFQKALGSDDPGVQQQAYYNIGNTQYRLGQKTAEASPQDTIKQWQGAVQAYDSALKLKADDADAKYNRDFVEKKLEKLEKEHPQQQKQDQNQQQQNQQNQQDQNQQQNQQNQQQNQNQQQQQNQNQQDQNQQQPQNSQGSQGNQQQQQGGQNGQNQAQNGGQPKDQNGQQQKQTAGNQPQDQKQQQQNGNNGGQQPQQQTAGNQDQKQNQGSQGQQQQQQQTAGNQNQNQNQNQNGQGQQQQPQTAQNDGKSGGTAGQAAAAADKDKNSGDQGDVALPEGELTKDQAKDLLNSLKGEEHIMPVAADTRSAQPQDQPVVKDW